MPLYFHRALTPIIQRSAKKYPVVTLLGPRQAGKSTLVQHLFPEHRYVNLESIEAQAAAAEDPRAFLRRFNGKGILDEVQSFPSLLSEIQVLVDEDPRPGQWILTGSHQLHLHASVAQSLAGRTAMLQLLPMSILELHQAGIQSSTDQLMLYGGYPGVYQKQLQPQEAYRDYLQTYIERDIRQLTHIHNLVAFQKCLRLLAGRTGQLVNFEGLANEVGISAPTVKSWISILEASYILFRLPPYFENFGKRLTKSQKIYFNDVGLLCYLLGIESTAQLERDPLRGHIFENLVVTEIVKGRRNLGLEPNCYFLQDSKGHELDLVMHQGSSLTLMEIKSGETFRSDSLRNFDYFREIIGEERVSASHLWYGGSESYDLRGIHVRPYREAGLSIRPPPMDELHPGERLAREQ